MSNPIPSAKDIVGPSPLIAIANEAPAKLIVDLPLPEPWHFVDAGGETIILVGLKPSPHKESVDRTSRPYAQIHHQRNSTVQCF